MNTSVSHNQEAERLNSKRLEQAKNIAGYVTRNWKMIVPVAAAIGAGAYLMNRANTNRKHKKVKAAKTHLKSRLHA